MRNYFFFFGFALILILIDQATKLLVHFNMQPGTAGQIVLIHDWFKLHYTLNPGMAFGMKLDHVYGKLILTTFRLAAMVGIAYYLVTLIKKEQPFGLKLCIASILGGAVGNLIDSVFYGVLLNNAPYDAPSPWFNGQVVDMIYFDIWEGVLPYWVPIIGNQYYAFWPIFNIADSSIFLGITFILIFQKKYFKEKAV